MSSTKSAFMSLHLGAFLLAATGLFSQIIALPAWDTTGYRTWVAAGVLFAWVWWREGHIKLDNRRDYGKMLLLGVLLGIHWVTYFYSMQISNVAIGMLSLYAYPVMTVFMEPLVKGTNIDWGDVGSGVFVLAGIYFLVPEFSMENNLTQGVLWGVVSAFTFALRNVLLNHWFSDQSSARSMSYQVLIVAVLMTPVLFISPHVPSHRDWSLLIVLGLIFTAFSHTLFGYSLRYLKAKTVALVSCMQPVYGVIYAMIFLHSIPDKATLAGGAIIVMAAVYESLREHHKSSVALTD